VKRVRYNRIPLREDEKAWKLRDLVKKPDRPFETRYTKNHDERIETVSRYGPFSKVISRPYPGRTDRSFYDTKTWWRAKTRRRTYPLPYTHIVGKVKQNVGNFFADAINTGAGYLAGAGNVTWDQLAQNAARSRFINEMRDKTAANLAVTLVEWEQSNKMIAYRSKQLIDMVVRLKKGDVHGAVQALKDRELRLANLKATRTKKQLGRASDGPSRAIGGELLSERAKRKLSNDLKRGSKSVANAVLELQYGWVPLVDDINKACMVLASNPPAHKVVGRGSYRRPYSSGNTSLYTWYINGVYNAKCHVQATVYVSNPNLALANQLGFVNPIATAWNVLPFTFLVDRYLIPVAQFLNSFTDLLGYHLEYAFTTTTRWVEESAIQRQDVGAIGYSTEGWYHSRAGGIPPFALKTQPFEGFKPMEGLTMISLVVQQFLSISK